MNRLIDSDKAISFYQMIWRCHPQSIRLFIDNRYVLQPFWDYVKGELPEAEWREPRHAVADPEPSPPSVPLDITVLERDTQDLWRLQQQGKVM